MEVYSKLPWKNNPSWFLNRSIKNNVSDCLGSKVFSWIFHSQKWLSNVEQLSSPFTLTTSKAEFKTNNFKVQMKRYQLALAWIFLNMIFQGLFSIGFKLILSAFSFLILTLIVFGSSRIYASTWSPNLSSYQITFSFLKYFENSLASHKILCFSAPHSFLATIISVGLRNVCAKT